MKNLILPVILLAGMMFCGCSQETSEPEGFPELYPVKVQVNKGTTALQWATVCLESAEYPQLSIIGVSDGNGSAILESAMGSYLHKGCPKGTFKVSIRKYNTEELDKLMEQAKALSVDTIDEELNKKIAKAESELKPLVSKNLLNINTTPIEISVDANTTELSFDVDSYK